MARGRIVSRITDSVLLIAAVVVVILLVRREVIAGSHSATLTVSLSAEEWERVLGGGHLIGPASARVKLVEFGDFQCPACAYLHDRVRQLVQDHEGKLAVLYRHLPLSIHPAAVMAALAAECAADQGRFDEFGDALFADQQWIGVNEWREFAEAAGVPDTQEFDRCVSDRDFGERVKEDMSLATALDITSVPTFAVDGVLFSSVSTSELNQRVRKAIERAYGAK